ncbi:mannosyltransferase [Paenibacillus rigui]|uniref:Mannosyltransferase n=2 Tax=Paenibacillus rigui TaxID=554312 RepID=A0A229UVU8_9BACL|nr:mannosyltransferase [Paenibacillus rigui]
MKQAQRFDFILLGITFLSAFLNMFNIWNDSYANGYYTSAVTSMVQSFHNFFFASFDPAGFVTVDKPPVTFWVQTIFAKVLGVHGWSVILPQALAGVGSVLLMYRLVKPSFGITAARWSSLIMACTPIAVAVARTNNVDALLVFTLLLATSMLFKGIRSRRVGWILGAFAMIGVGFNEKMLQAYMIVPAFYLFYLLAYKVQWKKKLAVLAAATAIMVGVSVSWAVVVDSIPQQNRPYMGSSQTNSVLELAFGYNGISRLTGNKGMGGGGGGQMTGQQREGAGRSQDGSGTAGQPAANADGGQAQAAPQEAGSGAADLAPTQPDGTASRGNTGTSQQPPGFASDGGGAPGQMPGGDGRAGGPGGGGMGGGAFGTGTAGPLRLFQTELSGQASWLLPFVAFACVGLLSGVRRRKQLTGKETETLFWLAWLLPVMAFFSVAGFFHHYYLIMLAPSIAVLAGAGWVELWSQYRSKEGWRRWLLPTGILAATAFELYVLQPYQSKIGMGWSIGIGAAGVTLALILFLTAARQKLASAAAVAGMLALLVAPTFWAATPMIYGGNSMLPQAGPGQLSGMGGGMPPQAMGGSADGTNADQTGGRRANADGTQRQGMGGDMNGSVNEKLLDYVTKNNTGEKYLFATSRATSAQGYIIRTGKAVMAMGGFSGSDPILTAAKLEQMVKNKEVKYFLISSGGGPDGGSSELTAWIKEHGTEVPKTEWQQTQNGDQSQNQAQDGRGGGPGMGNETLYQINP